MEKKETNLLDISKLIDDAFKGLRRYWVLFLVIISVSSSIFYFYAKWTYAPKYRASSTFVVNTNTALNYSENYYNKVTAEQMAKTFPYIILNNALQHIIAEDLGVDTVPGEITATAMEDTNMITIGVTAYSPEDAYNIMQSVIKNYPQVARSVIGETELNIIDETKMPVIPINSSNAKSSARMGFMMGALLCCLILAVYAMTRRTICREDDFKTMLNVKCLGSIPRVKFKKRSNQEQKQVLIDNRLVSYGFTESNRTIRTRIEKDALENGSKVYMISSAIPREGKSTVAANVALSLAGKGKKVVLVDLDLRNPSVRDTLGIDSGKKGLVDVLKGKVAWEDVTVPYKETSLYVLPGGEPIQTVSGILAGEYIGEIISELRQNADYVIVDTPPSSILSDAAQVVKHMDAGIYVVRQDYALVDHILDGISMLTDTGLRLIGCVLNCAETGITGYGYGYGYGYSHYGKYGKYGKYTSKYTKVVDDDSEK